MSVGFVMMAHNALHRAGQVARHLADHDCPVVIHVDRRTPEADFFALVELVRDKKNIHFAPRIACDWGTWSLVEASRGAAQMLLDLAPDLNHISLISGACLPIKPVDQIVEYLHAHPTTDFIESVTISEVPWIQDGLGEERFSMTFPFAWKRQKRLFDLWVDLQRRTGIKRRIPAVIAPHMGSQWWCLTRKTLENIFNDPERATFDQYFRKAWIPDESYYATLARRHSDTIESRSLTLTKFDFQGKPHLFYDDHLTQLRHASHFFARKVWPGARKLYGAFLGPKARLTDDGRAPQIGLDRVFSEAVARRTRGRPGLLMAGRFPNEGFENHVTAAPYAVFHGFDDLYADFQIWLSETIGTRAHGHLFAPENVEFAHGQAGFSGCLTTSAALRDYNPESFLTNLIWNTRGEHQSFLFSPRDSQGISKLLARDPNAVIAAISGAWALPLFRSGLPIEKLRAKAARLQRREAAHLTRLRERRTRARVRIWTLAEVLENPTEPLNIIQEDLSVPGAAHAQTLPENLPMEGIDLFLQELRNAGMNPYTAGSFGERNAPIVDANTQTQAPEVLVNQDKR